MAGEVMAPERRTGRPARPDERRARLIGEALEEICAIHGCRPVHEVESALSQALVDRGVAVRAHDLRRFAERVSAGQPAMA